jgi:hypothetical protein
MTLDAAETVLGFLGSNRLLIAISRGTMGKGNGIRN